MLPGEMAVLLAPVGAGSARDQWKGRPEDFEPNPLPQREPTGAEVVTNFRTFDTHRVLHHSLMRDARLLFLGPLLAALFTSTTVGACPLSAVDVIRADSFERCARSLSSFQRVAEDLQVQGSSPIVVLTRSFTLAAPTRVFAVADGRHFPVDAPAATLRIRFDGDESQSSVSVTDWGSSQRPVMHGFNVLADAWLEAGQHTVDLVASAHPSRPGRFRIGAGSGLSVLVQPLSRLQTEALPGVSANINVTTFAPAQGIDVNEGDADRPLLPLLTQTLRNPGSRTLDVVTLASGRGFHACDSGIDNGRGDALLGLRADGVCPSTHSASWSVNDIDPDAEMQAPLMLHGVQRLLPGQQRMLALVGSELAFGSDQAGSPSGPHENGVCWGLGSARMLSASGGGVVGAASSGAPQFCATYTWRCVASTIGALGCPPAGSDVVIASTMVQIPAGHDGIVLFNARTRIQAGNSDSQATAVLGIRVNGQSVGAIGIQQLAAGAAQASRTLSASYLSAPGTPSGALAVGTHLIEVTVNVSGASLVHPSVPMDLALTWFD